MTPQPVVYTGPTPDDRANIPAALTVRRQWVLWRGRPKAGHPDKLDKIPIDPTTLKPASTTDALTWGTFAQCCAALDTALEGWEQEDPATYCGGGIGYVFAPDDPYTGIDLDHCVDEVTGTIADWAQAYVDRLASYTEITPSQQGLHILVEGDLPPGGRRKDGVEMYEQGRFFTVTGWHLAETPPTIEARQMPLTNAWLLLFGPQVGDTVRCVNEDGDFTNKDLLTIKAVVLVPDGRLYADFVETPFSSGWPLQQCEREQATPPTAPTPTAPDDAILAKAFSAANAPKFQALWTGDWQRLAYASQSQADMALCGLLRFWTQDPAQLDRLMRQSGLMRPKWDAKRGAQTYGARTIAAALSAPHEHYTPPPTLLVSRNGSAPGPQPPDPFACPELPASAQIDVAAADQASLFLDDYIAFSRQWAPRAYEGFHEAAALFTLSTTAARRIKIEHGPHGTFTSLYMALAARTSLFTKTTAVDIALALLRKAGLQPLLADDDATPQAFLRSLTLHVPQDYGEMPPDEQAVLRARLAFAGQKGWFYEEWGQHLHSMMQKEGIMAAFRGILKRLDDHQEEFTYSTISRGRDVLHRPYVTLLANVTPADLKPFLRAQSPLWRDGYMARVSFICPDASTGSTARFPVGTMELPRPLITALASWHKRLGIPQVALDPIHDTKGKATGRYRPVLTQGHRETLYTLPPEVLDAYYRYDAALHGLMAQSSHEDLDGSYARFPAKALRIAGLLASLHDDNGAHVIGLRHWYRGQQIAERWRADLHKLVKQVSDGEVVSRADKEEQRVIAVLKTHGALTIRDINRWTKLGHGEILQCLGVLREAGVVQEVTTARAKKYRYSLDEVGADA